VTQIVEHLPSKCEALSSNPNTAKRKEKKIKVLESLDSGRLHCSLRNPWAGERNREWLVCLQLPTNAEVLWNHLAAAGGLTEPSSHPGLHSLDIHTHAEGPL
jgi:hypothetical protein